LIRYGFALAACVVAAAGLSSAASAQSAQPLLRLGSRGALVIDWQRILNRWILTTTDRTDVRLRASVGGGLAEDGMFGPKTVEVTRRWQRGSQLAPTGVVGLPAWVRWIGSNVTCCGAGLPNFGGVFPSEPVGDVGWWQVALNRWLARHGLSEIVVDGVYGSETRCATALFQRHVGLRATGIAGRATWERIQRVHDALRIP
jgi:peptidoglycan hydrolase-like protein with peptidoglycan-binding domain